MLGHKSTLTRHTIYTAPCAIACHWVRTLGVHHPLSGQELSDFMTGGQPGVPTELLSLATILFPDVHRWCGEQG